MDDVKKGVLEILKELGEKMPVAPQSTLHVVNIAKRKYGYNRKVVLQAVNFLYDEGYLKREKKNDSYYYRLSSKGHQEFTPTIYRKASSLSSTVINYQTGGISISGSGAQIGHITQTTINNIGEIDNIIKLINSSNMDENKKRDTILDAESLKNELAKSSPKQSILAEKWNSLVENAKIVNNAAEIFKFLKLLYPVIKVFAPHLPELPIFNN